MYYVYILKSERDNRYYYGQTDDMDRRLKEHNAGRVSSTSYRRPLRLVHLEEYGSREQALQRERQLKKNYSARQAVLNHIQ